MSSPKPVYIICAQGIPTNVDAFIDQGIRDGAYSVWHHLHGLWIISAKPDSLKIWSDWLTDIVRPHKGRCLVLEIKEQSELGGFLPSLAFDWLQFFVRDIHRG